MAAWPCRVGVTGLEPVLARRRACRAAWGSCDPGKRQVMMIVYNEASRIMSTGLLSDHRLDTSENKLF